MNKASLVASILIVGAGALYSQRPVLRQGISVQMPLASRAVATPAADEQNTTVVVITADGKIFNGVDSIDPTALSKLTQTTVYVKADARAPYQPVLAVLDALHGKSVVLLSAPPENAVKQRNMPPYGTRLNIPR